MENRDSWIHVKVSDEIKVKLDKITTLYTRLGENPNNSATMRSLIIEKYSQLFDIDSVEKISTREEMDRR